MSNDTKPTEPTIVPAPAETQEPDVQVVEKQNLIQRTRAFAKRNKETLTGVTLLVAVAGVAGYVGRATAPSIDQYVEHTEFPEDETLEIPAVIVDDTVA